MRNDSLETAFRSVDPLGEALHSLHMSGTFYSRLTTVLKQTSMAVRNKH